MTTLDLLARNSAAAVHESVLDVHAPLVGVVGAAQGVAAWRLAGYAAAGAAAGVAVVVTLLFAGPADEPADTIMPTTSAVVPTSMPESIAPPTTSPPVPPEETPVVAPVPGDDTPTESIDTEPPILVVTSPFDGEHLEIKTVSFTGSTEPGASVIASGKFPAKVDGDGRWSVSLVLAPGANGVRFVATDAAGNATEVRLTVHLDVEEPKETTTTVAVWEFSATQKYGTCSEPVAYDVFSGKAEPGSIVTVTSPFGGGSTTVNAEGKWSLKVEFPSAPFNEQFNVTVKDHAGSTKTFAFISLYEG